jgi:hypothetical protein
MYESQQITAEHRDLAAHAHRSGAEHHGEEGHMTGYESSRQALEHTSKTLMRRTLESRQQRATVTDFSVAALCSGDRPRHILEAGANSLLSHSFP